MSGEIVQNLSKSHYYAMKRLEPILGFFLIPMGRIRKDLYVISRLPYEAIENSANQAVKQVCKKCNYKL